MERTSKPARPVIIILSIFVDAYNLYSVCCIVTVIKCYSFFPVVWIFYTGDKFHVSNFRGGFLFTGL